MTKADENALLEAVSEQDTEQLVQILERAPDAVQAVDAHGWSALMRAVGDIDRDPGVIDLLLARGASVRHASPDGWTVLHALVNGTGEDTEAAPTARLVQRLVAAGADVEAITDWGWTPLANALIESDVSTLQALLAVGAKPDVRLSERGYPVFSRGMWLTHFCGVQPDGPELLRILVEAGADLGLRDRKGRTALEAFEEILREPEDDMDEGFLSDVERCAELLRGR